MFCERDFDLNFTLVLIYITLHAICNDEEKRL